MDIEISYSTARMYVFLNLGPEIFGAPYLDASRAICAVIGDVSVG